MCFLIWHSEVMSQYFVFCSLYSFLKIKQEILLRSTLISTLGWIFHSFWNLCRFEFSIGIIYANDRKSTLTKDETYICLSLHSFLRPLKSATNRIVVCMYSAYSLCKLYFSGEARDILLRQSRLAQFYRELYSPAYKFDTFLNLHSTRIFLPRIVQSSIQIWHFLKSIL